MIPKQIIYPLRYLGPIFAPSVDLGEAEFIRGFGELLKLPHACLPLGRARTGIYLLVKGLVAGKRVKVIMSPYTIPDLVNMVLFAGGVPCFVDFNAKSTNVNVDQLEQMLDDETACVILTHYHVNQAKLGDILNLCMSRGIAVVEDCAISLGGTVAGKAVGTQSDGGVYSLSSYKFLNYFWGGALFTKNSDFQDRIAEQVSKWSRLRNKDYRQQVVRTLKYDLATRPLLFRFVTAPMLRWKQRRSSDVQLIHQPRIESEEFDASLQSRPSAGAFAEWCSKIDKVASNLQHRRSIAAVYSRSFGELMIGAAAADELDAGCYANYPIWVGVENRDRVYKAMLLSGYDVGLSLYPNIHEHPKFGGVAGHSEETSKLCRSVLSLPCHPRVGEEYANALAKRLNQLL
jgi:dTDP-4-amino-4,6-dideoxygalactose transaminase